MDWVAEILGVWAVALLWWLGLSLVFYVLTQWKPCNPGRGWWINWRAAGTDLLYWLLMPFVTSLGRVAFLLLGVVLLYGSEPSAESFVLRDWPMWLQCLTILLIQDGLLYAVHRLFHSRALWKFHAVHHSPEVVDWTTAARFHPVNAIAEFALADAVVLLMGFSPMALMILGPVNMILSTMVHANLNWTFGPFRYVLASPVFHRWHHTSEAEGLDKNFASTFPFLDLLFGTFHMPKGRVPEQYGAKGETVPPGIVGQTLYPMPDVWAWCRRRPVRALVAVSGCAALSLFVWTKNAELAESVSTAAEVAVSDAPASGEPAPLRLSGRPILATQTAVALHAIANRFARGFNDGTVTLQDANGKDIALHQHRGRVSAVAFSPNGALLTTAAADRQVQVWDSATGTIQRKLSLAGLNPMSVAVASDGVVAAGTADGAVLVWNARGELQFKRHLSSGPIHALALSAGGEVVAIGCQSALGLWQTRTGQVQEFHGPRELVYAVALSEDGKQLAAGVYDGQLFHWRPDVTEPKQVIAAHDGPIYSLNFGPEGRTILTGGADQTVAIWESESGRLQHRSEKCQLPVFAASMGQQELLVVDRNQSPKRVSLTTGPAVIPAANNTVQR